MNILREGFRELGRRIRRAVLRRRLAANERTLTDRLTTLGRKAWDARAAGGDVAAAITAAEAQESAVAAKLADLDAQRKTLEEKRRAESERLDQARAAVERQKAPVDSDLAARRNALAQAQREADASRRRVAEISRATPADGATRETLAQEKARLEAGLPVLTQAADAASAAIPPLQERVRALQSDLDRVAAERRQVVGDLDRTLADVQKAAVASRADSVAVGRQKAKHLAELGGTIAAAGLADPAFAAELGDVRKVEADRDGLRAAHDQLIVESKTMLPGTMQKFAAIGVAGLLLVATAAYAATGGIPRLFAPRPAGAWLFALRQAGEECGRMGSGDKVKPEPVKANAGGPYRVDRGGAVTLDGSRSRGRCLKYEWIFAPKDCPEGVTGNPGARKEGAQVKTFFLCSMTVTLTVTSDSGSDSATAEVTVRARRWKPVKIEKQLDAFLTGSRLTQASGACLVCNYGRNVCALDGAAAFEGEQHSDHVFHKKPGDVSWKDTAYTMTQIHDSNGPFDLWWYVGDHNLMIQRAALINTDLNPGSELYKENLKRGGAIALLAQSVKAHEHAHGDLMVEAVRDHDPRRDLEQACAQDEEMAWRRADAAIAQADNAIMEAAGEAQVKARLAKNAAYNKSVEIFLPDSNTGKYERFTTPVLSQLGESGR